MLSFSGLNGIDQHVDPARIYSDTGQCCGGVLSEPMKEFASVSEGAALLFERG